MTDFQLPTEITCGYFDSTEFGERTNSPQRKVVKFEIEYYLADALDTYCDENCYPIHKDHIQIAKPGQIRWSKLPFTTMYVKFHATGILAEQLQNAPSYFQAYHTEEIIELINKLILQSENKSGTALEYYSIFLQLLTIILHDSEISSHGSVDYAVTAAAKRFMKEHFHEPISLSDIAASVNLSPSYFHSLFTATCTMTPHAYLISLRIDHAKRMLWDSTVSISDIASLCGFNCQQYFTKVFKQKTGTSPHQYRKSMHQRYLSTEKTGP